MLGFVYHLRALLVELEPVNGQSENVFAVRAGLARRRGAKRGNVCACKTRLSDALNINKTKQHAAGISFVNKGLFSLWVLSLGPITAQHVTQLVLSPNPPETVV